MFGLDVKMMSGKFSHDNFNVIDWPGYASTFHAVWFDVAIVSVSEFALKSLSVLSCLSKKRSHPERSTLSLLHLLY